MKLAEALLLRSDMKKKLASLRERIANNAVVQQGEKPHEDPAKLLKEAVGVLDELERLTLLVNAANLRAKLDDGRTLAQVLARRDHLAQQHALLQTAVNATKKEPDRYSLSEIKWVVALDVAKLQKQSDDLAGKLRELNARIQQANWQVDIE
jgi:ABC-type phosphate transport system auxiliary subunit